MIGQDGPTLWKCHKIRLILDNIYPAMDTKLDHLEKVGILTKEAWSK